MSAENPQPGWQFVHENLGPLRHTLRERVAQARLGVGSADRALSKSEYLAWLQQQIAMLKELIPELENAVAGVSEVASGLPPGASTDELDGRCEWLAWQLGALVSWAQAAWRTTPPAAYRRSFEAFRELPGAILDQFDRYFDVVALGAAGKEEAGRHEVTIDLTRVIDEALRQGESDVARQNRASAGVGGCLNGVGVLIAIAVFGWMILRALWN